MNYEKPKMELVVLEPNDIIRTSNLEEGWDEGNFSQ